MLEELIGCAGIPARGSWRLALGGLLLPSTKPRLPVLFCVDGQALLEPSRRAREEGDCCRDMGADGRSWPPSPSPPLSQGAKRRKRVRMLVVRSSNSREIAWFRWTSSTTQVRRASMTRS